MRLRSSATHFIETKSLPRGKLLGLAPTEASHEGFDTLIQSVPQSGKVVFFFWLWSKKKRKQFLGERINQAVIEKWMKNPQRRREPESSSFIMKQSTNTKERSVTNLTLGTLYLFKIVIFSA